MQLAASLAARARALFPEKSLLLRPRRAMVAIYEDAGDAYAAHRDNEWLKGEQKWMNFRGVTAICYMSTIEREGGKEGDA